MKLKEQPQICLIHVRGQRAMTMSQIYTEYLKRKGISYDLITMDVMDEPYSTEATNHYQYKCSVKSKLQRLAAYTGYRKYVKEILIKNDYRFIIVWCEITAALLSGILIRHFRNKYCVNVRDLFVNKRKILGYSLGRAIKNSSFTTVSSELYLDYLPQFEGKYQFIHSMNNQIMLDVKQVLKKQQLNNDGIIRIVFVGGVRFYSHFYKLIDEIANDKRYCFLIAGFGDEPIKEYVKKNKILNVHLQGAFDVKETSNYLAKADVLFNLYGTEDINLRTALSNKLYYAICLNIPLLAYRDTYTFELAESCGIGYAVDESYKKHTFADDFYKWYQNRDVKEAAKKCDSMIDFAQTTQNEMIQRFEECIEG